MAVKKIPATVEAYLESLSEEQEKAVRQIRSVIKKNLPKGFSECIQYGMISYVVPLSFYSKGYHCDPKQPLPFLSVAAQKNAISLYHMGMYADPVLADWFAKEYLKEVKKKPDMGKSCIRFKDSATIPFALIGALVLKMKPADWVKLYEKKFRK
jgi:uncharacterized protein YdhG (YjbR/CyaY superfamily)